MHCATIATAVGGVPYIIEPGVTGLLTQPRDYEAFAQHIRTLAENGAYRLQLAENLHERASRLLSIEATVSHQIQIYETILRRERAPKKKAQRRPDLRRLWKGKRRRRRKLKGNRSADEEHRRRYACLCAFP